MVGFQFGKEIAIMPTTGYLREKKGRYYAVLNLYDSTGKRIQKSHATGLPVKNNKRKAEQILKQFVLILIAAIREIWKTT